MQSDSKKYQLLCFFVFKQLVFGTLEIFNALGNWLIECFWQEEGQESR